jgi:hypothetical protein
MKKLCNVVADFIMNGRGVLRAILTNTAVLVSLKELS